MTESNPQPIEVLPEIDGGKAREGTASRKRILLILLEGGGVLALLAVWLLSEKVRQSNSLLLLFFYSFPSEFMVGLVPHEPILIYFGQAHQPWVVALVAVVSTVMAEGLNYSFLGLFYGIPAFRAAFQKKAVKRIAELFSRMPFTAVVIAGFTPIPFFPVRFLVVITEYPVWKYLLGVFISRGPRFFLLALLGASFEVPSVLLLAIFFGMLLLVNIPALLRVLLGRG